MSILVKILSVLAVGYAAICLALFLAQTKLLFPAGLASGAARLPDGSERLVLALDGGERLHGVHLPPAPGSGDGPVVLGFGGNGWNAEAAALALRDLYPEHRVVAFHYRGYRPSTGSPSSAALLADAPKIHDFVAERFGTDRIVAVGFSIGSGVAARLARERRLRGLILVTPFDSLAGVAQDHYRWLPVSLLFRHHMRPAEELKGVSARVAIIAAERDRLILPRRTDALRAALGTVVFDETIADAGHNDIYDRSAFRRAMRDALHRVLLPSEAEAADESR